MPDHAAAIRGLPRWHPNPVIRSTIETIRRCGWQVTSVGESADVDDTSGNTTDCGFSYTAGLSLHSIPELSVYGLDPLTAHYVLNELGDLLHREDWRDLVAGQTDITLQTVSVTLRLIEQVDKDELILANLLFPDYPTLQVVWPDEYGHFPWEDPYTLLPMHQPLKGIPALVDAGLRRPHLITVESGPERTRPRKGRRIAGH
ncbi:DUF4262 domain-containing protein [Gordonia sp. zg691]|uniref:DUF4262 domain-containing protein n=1 Tax=Gordonia jinghuaiqii TaxID=2758710 RepID=UPI00166272F4|nr:DUF4262 domain-containing protein [Gordonia jinghuaiqii]MBD0860920.1 DUF4262 domain-containing protein [Gordonia jinghuaiqii]